MVQCGALAILRRGMGQLTFGETERWRAFTPGDGVNVQQIFVLYRDNQGHIWAGTDNGLWMMMARMAVLAAGPGLGDENLSGF